MDNCNQTTCQLIIDAERRWTQTHTELNKRIELVDAGLDALIDRVDKIEQIDTQKRITAIEQEVLEHIPKIPVLLDDLKKGQESIFKQLGRLDDHDKRLTALESEDRREAAAVINAKSASWKSKWQVMFGSLLMSGLVASMIWDTSLRNWNNPVVIIVLCLGGAVFGAEFLRTWRELKGSVAPDNRRVS